MRVKVKINTKDELNKFIDVCCKYHFDIDACYGRYIVDAKSLLGMLSIGLEKKIDIVPYYDTDAHGEKLYREIERWRVD